MCALFKKGGGKYLALLALKRGVMMTLCLTFFSSRRASPFVILLSQMSGPLICTRVANVGTCVCLACFLFARACVRVRQLGSPLHPHPQACAVLLH